MADLLPSTLYPSVRAAIDTSLDSRLLPDAIIALDIYKAAAVRDVLAIDASAESRTSTEFAHAQAAAVYFCAARLVTALPQIVRETRDTHAYQRAEVKPDMRAAELRALASAELDAYLDMSPAIGDMPTLFTVGRGRRGRW
jgi:hypothetical protein